MASGSDRMHRVRARCGWYPQEGDDGSHIDNEAKTKKLSSLAGCSLTLNRKGGADLLMQRCITGYNMIQIYCLISLQYALCTRYVRSVRELFVTNI